MGRREDRRLSETTDKVFGANLRGYVICTEPRSGSNYLCQLLASTRVLGAPVEYFNIQALRGRGHLDYPDDPESQLAQIPRLGATPNGIYGVKVFSNQFDYARETRWAERLPRLSFVYLTRLDLLGQAISHARAAQTQQWTARGSTEREPVYDFEAINAELLRLARAQARWTYFLARNDMPVVHVIYEHLVQNPQLFVDAIARLVGVTEPATIDASKVQVRVQRDVVNDDWRARFVGQARNLSLFL
jgi:trehalose 2-sulfotransferase